MIFILVTKRGNNMQKTFLRTTNGWQIPVYACGLCVAGSGAAAWNAAHTARIEKDIPVYLVTEGVNMGTSRNTGSDKQTYYKQSTTALHADSPLEMAQDFAAGGAMHGDIALTEACGSLAGFYKLISLGVPFPHDRYGEYPGYRTDHDEKSRATSLGPLTSKKMTEVLEKAARDAGVAVFDGYRAVQILVRDGEACGLACLSMKEIREDNPAGLVVFAAPAVIWAVGGPSALYHKSVYPESQTCALGTALAAGASGVNMTEFQYGLASLAFRWNVSGSYQQVIPRYISTAADGVSDVREFLTDTFGDSVTTAKAVFRKGYEWPFAPEKLCPIGSEEGSFSSWVDIAVYREIASGRRVYMDFTKDSIGVCENGTVTAAEVGEEAYIYLENCRSLKGTPVQRLRVMNEKAYQLYLDHGIDLEKEPLEVGVCAQHMNGGLEGDIWYESPTLPRLFICGEANGVFGIRRPGGSALNSTQVSSRRAAEKAVYIYDETPAEITEAMLQDTLFLAGLLAAEGETALSAGEIRSLRADWGRRMDSCGAFLRTPEEIETLAADVHAALEDCGSMKAADLPSLIELQIHLDTMLTRYAVLTSMSHYIRDGGLSRGSYLILENGQIPARPQIDTEHSSRIGQVRITREGTLKALCSWQDVRPIPAEEHWFEEVYNRSGRPESYR
ncbi:MAG: FAD-binding protein [Ruminococcaceae bacterium]|nr:FAD-binding protein [Oscillospiraceae bacterium]